MVYGRKHIISNRVCCGNKARFSCDNHAGLEGMPLQLLIIVVIAVMALGMIMYWMSSVNEPPKNIKVISVEIDGADEDIDLSSGKPRDILITVYDQDLKKVDGAIVTLDGSYHH